MSADYITTVSDVEYPSGFRGKCYALVSETGTATAITMRRAIDLQREGVSYAQPHPVYPDDFAVWFGPDFNAIGSTGAPPLPID